jgi:hypothetical protein
MSASLFLTLSRLANTLPWDVGQDMERNLIWEELVRRAARRERFMPFTVHHGGNVYIPDPDLTENIPVPKDLVIEVAKSLGLTVTMNTPRSFQVEIPLDGESHLPTAPKVTVRTTSTATPVTPKTLSEVLIREIDPIMVESVNALLARKAGSSPSHITFTVKEVIAEYQKRAGKAPSDDDLNFEPLYKDAWNVTYDRPGYDESYDAFWVFKAR